MKKVLIYILLLISLFFIANKVKVYSIECDPGVNIYGRSDAELNELIDKCTAKGNELSQKRSTLTAEIQYMDTQIYLTTLKIQDTEQKIIKTEKEIDNLSSKIEGLDDSLSRLLVLFQEKAAETYRKRDVSWFTVLFDTNNATDFINQVKYIKSVQDSNQKLIVQVQQAKLNYEDQKKLREKMIKELDDLRANLNNQKLTLQNQQNTKRVLLTETQNSEATYQDLVKKARQQLAGFAAFTSSGEGGLKSFGTGSNGWYYTQRDPAWGNLMIPNSSYSVQTAGCALTSVAMVCKSYGQNITPATMAQDYSKYFYGDLWNWAFSCEGKSSTWFSGSKDEIKSYLERNIPVILKLVAPSVSGLHFIVAWKWDEGKNDFIIHDPYYGPDMLFSSRYNQSQIITAIAIN